MGEPLTACSRERQDQTKAFEQMLGHWLPFCSSLTWAADGSIVAAPPEARSSLRLEFQRDGTVRFSERDSAYLSSRGFFFDRVELGRIEASRVRTLHGLLRFAEVLQRIPRK